MGDPFSVAASTASFLSLGIQITQGLAKYLQAWKSHDKEIGDMLHRLENLSLTLTDLTDILPIVESLDNSTSETLGRARQNIRSCAAALTKLHQALIKSESITPPAGIFDRMHNIRLRSMHLFDSVELGGLQNAVAETQRNLASAVENLQLHLAIEQRRESKEMAMRTREQVLQIPDAVEKALIDHLGEKGQLLNRLQKDIQNTSEQHYQAIQQVVQSISALQLGMIQKPSLLESVSRKRDHLQKQASRLGSRSAERCTCRSSTHHKLLASIKPLYHVENTAYRRWSAAVVTTSMSHGRNCPLYEEAEHTKQLGIRLAYSGALVAGAIHAALSISGGSGGFSISPRLAFTSTVPCNAPIFKIFETYVPETSSSSDLQTAFTFRMKELLRLYSDGKASPRDIDEEGNNILHVACDFVNACRSRVDRNPWDAPHMDENMISLYFLFLQDLQELGVPLNGTNAKGLTPLAVLMEGYRNVQHFTRDDTLFATVGHQMYDIGAEFWSDHVNTKGSSYGDLSDFISHVALFPELAVVFGCNEVGHAVLAKSRSWLVSAVSKDPPSVNQPNALGQTPLHLSVGWTEGVRLLIAAGAAIDAADNAGRTPVFYAAWLGLLDAVVLLDELDCIHHFTPTLSSKTRSLLEVVGNLEEHLIRMAVEDSEEHGVQMVLRNATALVDTVIGLVIRRRRTLEYLARTSLNHVSVHRLGLSSGSILDHKAPLAISMLKKIINVPETLNILTPCDGTVYHLSSLHVQRADALWAAGFHDIEEFDGFGRSPLMKRCLRMSLKKNFNEELGFLDWLIFHGADVHRRQGFTWQSEGDWLFRKASPARPDLSSTTALHYIAAGWGEYFYRNLVRFPKKTRQALTDRSKQLIRTVLLDPISDRCDCACSTKGCSTFTMFGKTFTKQAKMGFFGRRKHYRRAARDITRSIAVFLDVDGPGIEWLRYEMLRLITFDALRLRHTCCSLIHGDADVIVELGDEDWQEIRDEQAEQVDTLENLLHEFKIKLDELATPFVEFVNGYWKKRMREVRTQNTPLNLRELEIVGVRLRESASSSSSSSDED